MEESGTGEESLEGEGGSEENGLRKPVRTHSFPGFRPRIRTIFVLHPRP